MIFSRARCIFLAGAASLLLFASAAQADDERVLIVAPRATPLVKKLEAELTTAHLAIDFWFVDSKTIDAAADIRARGVAREARILLRTSDGDDTVEVWVADHDGEVVRFRERVTVPGPGDSDLLAVQTHEVVRAALLGEARAPAPHAAPPPPASIADTGPAQTEAWSPRVALKLGPSWIGSPGTGLGMGNVALGASWLATEHVSIDAVASLPVVASTLNGPEGSARVGVGLLGAGASWSFTARAARIRPWVGLGMALAWTHVDGIATPPFVSHSDDVLSWAPYADAGISVGLTQRFALCADVLGGVAVPPARIAFANREVAAFGEPIVAASSSIRVTW